MIVVFILLDCFYSILIAGVQGKIMSDLLMLENFTLTLLTLKNQKVNINQGAREILLFLVVYITLYHMRRLSSAKHPLIMLHQLFWIWYWRLRLVPAIHFCLPSLFSIWANHFEILLFLRLYIGAGISNFFCSLNSKFQIHKRWHNLQELWIYI